MRRKKRQSRGKNSGSDITQELNGAKSSDKCLSKQPLKRQVEKLLGPQVINATLTTHTVDHGLSSIAIKRKHEMTAETLHLLDSHSDSKRSRSESSLSVTSEFDDCVIDPAWDTASSSLGFSCCHSVEADKPRPEKELNTTSQRLKQHISSLSSLTKPSSAEEKVAEPTGTCELCGLGVLVFAPKPIYCMSCNFPIKRSANFHCIPGEEPSESCFCSKCFSLCRRVCTFPNGKQIPKSTFTKLKNEKSPEEPWVQCDGCEAWLHQICGLYNQESDPEGKNSYKCPKCLLGNRENGHCSPSLSAAFSDAKDLKPTVLSSHIEHRLAKRLNQDREERAKAEGKSLEEVPGVEDLVVRVVLSEKRNLPIKDALLDVLKDQDYPRDLPYTAKMILMFQKIDGFDVCIFSMYVQEYGSDCKRPNQRYAYISYIDSVKYFRPNIRSSNGQALRTLVYHEVLIGYLDYIKTRGFTTCFLWACTPRKGDEYILYCHPETQKTPKPDLLRQWYYMMIKKAASEGIIVNATTLHDRFFAHGRGLNTKITAARLPYFEGDYYPLAVDYLLDRIQIERKECAKKAKKVMTKTTMKSMGLSDLSDFARTDVLLVQKLEETFATSKENFMVIDLQLVCSHCQEPFLSDKFWSCSDKPNRHLCERCHTLEASSSSKRKSLSYYSASVDVPLDTNDEDDVIESDLLNNRDKFITFCQSKNYQFDTLRRAKHSTMMIFYHLRHLFQPSEATNSCRKCHTNEEKGSTGQYYSCEICPNFNVCAACYQQKGASCHIHKLTPPDSRAQEETLCLSERDWKIAQPFNGRIALSLPSTEKPAEEELKSKKSN